MYTVRVVRSYKNILMLKDLQKFTSRTLQNQIHCRCKHRDQRPKEIKVPDCNELVREIIAEEERQNIVNKL